MDSATDFVWHGLCTHISNKFEEIGSFSPILGFIWRESETDWEEQDRYTDASKTGYRKAKVHTEGKGYRLYIYIWDIFHRLTWLLWYIKVLCS